jgi:hypothetical protein
MSPDKAKNESPIISTSLPWTCPVWQPPDELELEELLDEELLLEELEPLIVPVETVNITRSSLDPSSRRSTRSVCEPAARLLKVARLSVV